jgi:hypothetical protein
MNQRILLVLILGVTVYSTKAQKVLHGFNEYGIYGDLYVPQFAKEMRNTLGYGTGFFSNYRITDIYSVFGRVGFRSINHANLDLNKSSTFHDLNVTLAGGFSLPQLSGTRLLLGVQPTRLVASSGDIKLATLSHLNTLNIYGGIQTSLNQATKLELSYTYPVYKTNYDSYVDAIPQVFSVGIYINFNRYKATQNEYLKMRKTIEALKFDTLYFINRSCEGELSDEQLKFLLAKHYTYSAFKVLSVADIENGLLPKNPIHFAVIGQHYYGLGEPLTTGIFLLDRNMENVEFPYKRHVPIHNSTLNCMGSFLNIAEGIKRFDRIFTTPPVLR